MTWNIGYLLFFFALNIIKSFWHHKFRRIDVIYSYFSKNTLKLKIIIRLKKKWNLIIIIIVFNLYIVF